MSEIPWYRAWFGETYLDVYPHRNHEEAAQGVDLLLSLVAPDHLRKRLALDLACGAGRHLRALRKARIPALGLDLSAALLREGMRQGLGRHVVQGDMLRLPFAAGSFGLVTSFFTSFGYFEQEDQDLQVLTGVHRCLVDGGWLLLDFLHAARVRAALVSRSERTVPDGQVVELRRLIEGGRRVEKEIRIERAGEVARFVERVRLYEPVELISLLSRAGFQVEHHLGDYAGGPPGPEATRTLLLASRL
jgi:SAM-dependent methyltransferase